MRGFIIGLLVTGVTLPLQPLPGIRGTSVATGWQIRRDANLRTALCEFSPPA